MYLWKATLALGCLIVLGVTGLALAHSGRTDASGCHHNRRTGGYHCHGGGSSRGYSSGGSGARASATRLQVIAIPRARVWVDDVYIGMSPTKAVKVDNTQVKVRVEHAALGSHETTTTISYAETTELTVRW